MYYGWNNGWWGFLMMILFWVVVVGAVYLVVRGATGGREDRPRRSDPRDILAERFARGEIGEDEYRDRLRVLEGREPAGKPG